MDDEIVLLLQLVKKNGNVENLTKHGYQYSQIATMINIGLENKLVEFNINGVILTDIGENLLVEYNKKLGRKNSEAIISPQKEYFLEERRSKYDIYLPENI